MINIGIIGLGYVGLPLAIEFSKFFKVIGYDLNSTRISQLKKGHDNSNNIKNFKKKLTRDLIFTTNSNDLKECNFYIITVPTPINSNKKPDLSLLIKASKLVGKLLKKNDIVIYESTVYPGATEEECVPILEKYSKLTYINSLNEKNEKNGFYCGYSPERINPGDKKRTLTKIIKITSGSTSSITNKIDKIYKKIIKAGTHKVSEIRIAEAAKVIENTQRDINISLINEISIIFDKLNIDTSEVLKAANTKWNFLDFKPGLVGGHCIGVDPYYLKYKSEKIGYYPKIISAGRKINDHMGNYTSAKIIKILKKNNIKIQKSKILIMGFTFKENCSDIRNSKVFDIYRNLIKNKCIVNVYDPWVSDDELKKEYKITSIKKIKKYYYDVMIFAVGHNIFKKRNKKQITQHLSSNGLVIDIKNIYSKSYGFKKI
jgi:nucleotide sugar dehydrogenase